MFAMRILRSEADYKAALAEYEAFFDAEPPAGSPEGDRFELLGLLIAKYEDGRFAIPAAPPVDVIRFVMEANGYTQADLGRVLGSRSRASEILAGKRDLSIDHIRRIARDWRVPASALVGMLEAA